MDNDVWFKEELEPSLETFETQVRGRGGRGRGGQGTLPEDTWNQARGVVGVSRPEWELLGHAPLSSGKPRRLWLVRLRFQFEVNTSSSHFIDARCEADLEPAREGEPTPSVYDLYPQDLYEGEPRTISLDFSPNLTVGNVGVHLGEIKTDIRLGRVQPVVVGYPGQDDRNPHWNLRAMKYPLEKSHSFWLVLAQPVGCSDIRLHVKAQGTIKTSWGPVRVHPKRQVGKSGPSILIPSGVIE